jgi:NAD+ kinase
VLCVAGGSLGFLTPFRVDEMVDAIRIALDLVPSHNSRDNEDENTIGLFYDDDVNVFPPNMGTTTSSDASSTTMSRPQQPPRSYFGVDGRIGLSIRMRLECRVVNRDGGIRARFNVLNEVVIDRGSSPYLAALECFCDDVHLTTVQADGLILSTPTGSTAYSMAAGGSVVHPAVPCILLTPICPHVLSFRSMVFPDSVEIDVYVPQDARDTASVSFDGKHRQELRKGDSVQVRMSRFPLPTINRLDHSADWLGGLKRTFHFNSRPRQQPLQD